MKKIFFLIFTAFILVFSGCQTQEVENNDEQISENSEFEEETQNQVKENPPIEKIVNNSNSRDLEYYKKVLTQDLSKIELDEEQFCYEFEEYDSEYDECYIDYYCETNEECDEFDKYYDIFLENLDKLDYSEEFENIKYHNHNEELKQSDENFITSYNINQNLKISLDSNYEIEENLNKYQENKETHNKIWLRYTNLIPQEMFAQDVSKYILFTDGQEETLAYVRQDEENIDNWFLVIDIIDYEIDSGKEFTYTLIHETAHILTLNKNQVEYQTYEEDCQTHYISEGCLKENSYFYQFYKEFWNKDLEEQAQKDVEEFYYNNEDKFVTDYAATNPGEDIAESFTKFVLSPKSQNNQIKDNKINFFYQFDELKEIRLQIRQNLDKDLRKLKSSN